MYFATKSLALSFAAAAGLSGLNTLTALSAQAATRCDSGMLLGRYTLKSELNNKYVRAGIGSGAYVGAKSNSVGGSTSWETFDIYDLGNRDGLNGGTYALRSTQDPNRWVSVNSQNALKLMRGCNTASKTRLFRANRVGNILQLQSLSNQQWVIQRSNNMLYANAATMGGNVPKALQYRLTRIGSGPTSPSPQPQVNLNGWFRGNNKGVYSVQRSGNSFQMKGFLNGKPFNLITGNIQGNIINASWKNYCNRSTGSLKLRITSNGLVKVGGNPGFNTSWSPTQNPGSISNTPACQQQQPQVNLNGWFRGNNKGVYSAQRSGNSFQMKGFLNGKPFNLITGNIQGNIINASWKNYCNRSTGSLKLRITSNGLVKVGGNPGFNTSWSPTQNPGSISNTPACQQQQSQVNLNGWFRGNNKGVYSVQRSGNSFQMKGFLNGKPFNLITGNIQGNIINASWKNYCNRSTGSLKLRITSNGLVKVGGNPGFNTSWSPTQNPGSISNTPACQQQQSQVNLNGWFRGNNKGVYSVQRSGNSFQMKGFLNGKPFNLITGNIQGNIINASWKNYCNRSTGSLKLRITSNGLVKVGGNPGFNTSWSPTQNPGSISNTPAC
ncbi:fascin domain-containing protein [Prochlorococcus sp. MIT 1306]|uniref:fascin domain-containing protein n=1 Tax=Prochlorococcus sp. MIT 1306 TaxID=1799667 RepID=UPI0039B5F1B4